LLKSKRYDHVGAIIDYENGALDKDQIIELFQHLIDSGLAWQLQGAYGRMAHALCAEGYCHRPGETNHYES